MGSRTAQVLLAELGPERELETPGMTQRGQQLNVRASREREVADPKRRTLLERRDALLAGIAPRLDAADRTTWGVGFVRRLELGTKSC